MWTPQAGIVADVLRGPARMALRRPRAEDDVDRLESLRSCAAALALPLNSPQGRGALLFAHPRPGFFDPERAAVLQAVGLQVEVLLAAAVRSRDLQAEKKRLTDLEEEARKRMARDLHDGPTQVMASIAMRANYARRLMQRDRKAAAVELEQLEEMARQTTKELRAMLYTLRPLILESHGLVAALAQLADKMNDTHGVNVVVEAAADAADGVDPALQGVAFYVAEEALNNARKHAAAERHPPAPRTAGRGAGARGARRRRRLQRRRCGRHLLPTRQPGHGQHPRARRARRRQPAGRSRPKVAAPP